MTWPVTEIRFSAYYGAVFLALGIYLPFWPLWLGHRGLGAADIGLLLALASWVRIPGMLMVGRVADRSGRHRGTIIVLAGISLLGFAAFWPAQSFWALLAVQLVWAFLFHSLIPLSESLTMSAVLREGLDYGRMRLWGSIAFILGAFGAGELLTDRSVAWVFWLILAALALTLAFSFALPRQDPAAAPVGRDARPLVLVRDHRFLLFLGAAGLLQASHAVYYGFSALHWRTAGFSEATIGWLWAEGVIAEILLFTVSGAAVRRLGPTGLLALAGLGGTLRWALLAISTDLWVLIAAQALHAVTFGAAHLGAMHFIVHRAPPSLAATAQTLYAAVSGGLFMGLAMLLAGWLYADIAGSAFYAMAALSLAGLGLAIWLARLQGQDGPGVA